MPNAPAASRANEKSTRVSHHRFTGITRHSLRNGFGGLLRALPGDRACLPPSRATRPRKLDASVGASGPHGFAVRDSLVRPHKNVPEATASTASRPNVHDDGQRPSQWGQDGERCRFDLPDGRSGIFFQKGLDKRFVGPFGDLPVGQISALGAKQKGAPFGAPFAIRLAIFSSRLADLVDLDAAAL
jgi:hypothetical protein